MFILANLLSGLAVVIGLIIQILIILVFLRALISWVEPNPHNQLVQFLYKTTEPLLEPIRRRLPSNFRFGIDVSPIIAFLILLFLKYFLVSTLLGLVARLG